jgi:dihydrofolate reductase
MKAIIAVSSNNGIGLNGKIPWRIQEDMHHFRTITSDSTVIMGRLTAEELIAAHVFPLKRRKCIVVSSTFSHPEATTVSTLDEIDPTIRDKAFIIGGARLYNEAFLRGMIKEAWVTRVQSEPESDTFVDIDHLLDACDLELTWNSDTFKADERNNQHDHRFERYNRAKGSCIPE